MSFLCLATGCAGTSVLRPHPERMARIVASLDKGLPVPTGALLTRETAGRDKLLYLMERGRVSQLQGDWESSIHDYQAALAEIAAHDAGASYTVSGGVAQGAAVTLNDNVIPYRGDGYERIMLLVGQCLNYLMLGRAEDTADGRGGARPLALRLIQEQQRVEHAHARQLMNARAEGQRQRTSGDVQHRLVQQYAGMDSVAGRVKNSFCNAYGFALAGVVLEVTGDTENAKVMFKKALEMNPDSPLLAREVARLEAGRPAFKPGEGELLVFFEDGFVVEKQEVKFSIPVIVPVRRNKAVSYEVTLTAVAFPYYSAPWREPAPLLVSQGGQTLSTSEVMTSFDALAMKALQEKIPLLAVRQVLRSAAKAAAGYSATQEVDPLVGLLIGIFNVVTENADRRSWVTLPAFAGLTRVPLAAGTQDVELRQGGATRVLPVTIVAGGRTLVWVSCMGSALQAYTSILTAPVTE